MTPELNPATIAMIPIAITVIAISSSIKPKPPSFEATRNALPPGDAERRGGNVDAGRSRPGQGLLARDPHVDAAHPVPPGAGWEWDDRRGRVRLQLPHGSPRMGGAG